MEIFNKNSKSLVTKLILSLDSPVINAKILLKIYIKMRLVNITTFNNSNGNFIKILLNVKISRFWV